MDDQAIGGRKSLRKSQLFGALPPISPPGLRTSRSTGSFSPAIQSRDPSESRAVSHNASQNPTATKSGHGELPQLAHIYMNDGVNLTLDMLRNAGPPQSVDDVVRHLNVLRQEMGQNNADRAVYAIRETAAGVQDRRIHQGADIFANCRSTTVATSQTDSRKIKFKQHKRHKKDAPEANHVPIPIKSSKDRAPRYQFHHIEIDKNIITPRAMRDFVPHLRDVDESQEKQYEAWVQELEDTDKKLGFQTMSREQKVIMTMQAEKAALVSLYLEYWVDELAIPGCNMTSLFQLAGPEEIDDSQGPPSSYGEPEVRKTAKRATTMLKDGFNKVFSDGPLQNRIELRQVLRYCRFGENSLDSKPTARDDLSEDFDDEDEQIEGTLGSYSILGCQICHQQSCEHGDYTVENEKQHFTAKVSDLLKRRRLERGSRPLPSNRDLTVPCTHEKNNPFCPPNGMTVVPNSWTDKQRAVLRSMWVTLLEHDEFEDNPRCEIASWLNRPCREVRNELRRMEITLPQAPPQSTQPIKALAWYDRYKKSLLGNWADHLKVHAYNKRETVDPCSHEGPCKKGSCDCVDKGLLCEKFCGCTLECCAYKFNGCACHSRGKNCLSKQKANPCICVLLNRECDPSLCGSCGIKEDTLEQLRCDKNAVLPRPRCRNSDLQRGQEKDVVVGRSQLQGVGYGLYTAEPIAQDEFVMEYKGEIITADEGTRREARQGFDEPAPVSFNFQLLDTEGLWIDAAIYGNLSRYINHAPEKDRWGCNIQPKIVYVNGEFRIKFIAIRDIAVGEELFFNYGEYFPNLTEKLLNDTPVVDEARRRKPRAQHNDDQPKRRRGRPRRSSITAAAQRQNDRPARVQRLRDSSDEDESDLEDEDKNMTPAPRPSRKRKRGVDLDSSQEDYTPTRNAGGDDSLSKTDGSPAAKLRLRARQSISKSTAATPEKPIIKPKGKRGGARPGSGRPRKHPLPLPKEPAAPQAASSPKAAASPAEVQTPERRKRRRGSPDRRSSQQRNGSARLSKSMQAVPDSEDESADGEQDSDEDESDDGAEGAEGTRKKKQDRAMRKRRPPAKFRGEEVWRGRSSSQ
ncbi:SET domain-containing protein [Sarocladium implicatum]|nr:SET domain-containing protein [Sarocladium implicatum]